ATSAHSAATTTASNTKHPGDWYKPTDNSTGPAQPDGDTPPNQKNTTHDELPSPEGASAG
ncbi:MAG TPA: hypothetical protein VFX70_00355, partial [Mycobacteriales bacterium]|nr:hypothetical protein [Mycobacteriales bacterium]